MYIITFRRSDKVVECAATNQNAIFELAMLLEESRLPFKVSNRLGPLVAAHFGWSNFEHWLTGEAVI